MPPCVQRFVARIKPHRDHPDYFEWQTAIACLFVGEDSHETAQALADAEIRRRGWERIEFVERATLIEARVRNEGGAVLDAYVKAQAGTIFYVEELDEIPFRTKASPAAIAVLRLTESFVDSVVSGAGGERIDTPAGTINPPKTADYRIDDLILELKDLQRESLEVETRQRKLAALFALNRRPDGSSVADPSTLSEERLRQYVEIVGAPVRKRLVDAGRQVSATLARLADSRLQGGAILLNTGYGSLSHDYLVRIATDYAARSKTLNVVVCISAYTVTDGFDTVAHFVFDPREGGIRSISSLRESFWREIDKMMDAWARGGFQSGASVSPPLRPIVFEGTSGQVTTVPAPKPPSSFKTG